MARLVHGQVTLTTSAQVLTSTVYETSVILVKALSGNADDMYIGGPGVTTATGWPLSPGEVYRLTFINKAGEGVIDLKPSDLYVVGSTGDKVSWQALRQ